MKNKSGFEGKGVIRVPVFMIMLFIVVAIVSAIFGTTKIVKVATKTEQEVQSFQLVESEKLADGTTVTVARNTKKAKIAENGRVTIHYQNENGEVISNSETITGKIGDWYTTSRKQIFNYVAVGDEPINKNGYYTLGNIDVVYVYKEARTTVSTNVKDDSATIRFANAKHRQEYSLYVEVKAGNQKVNGGQYTVTDEGNTILKAGEIGEFVDGELYVGTITVRENGTSTYKIKEDVSAIGYKPISADIELSIEKVWDNDNAKFNVNAFNNEVEGVSTRITNDNKIIVTIQTSKYKNQYGMQVISRTADEYVDGTQIKVTKENNIIREGVTQNGRLIIGTFEIKNDSKEEYILEEIPQEGYKKVLPGPQKIIIENKYDATSKKYKTTATYNTNIEGFEIEINENIVNIILQTKKLSYDINMKKFLSQVDGEVILDREPKITLNEEKELVYEQPQDAYPVANEQLVTFTLRAYNEGVKNANGIELIDEIPAGLDFYADSEINKSFGWKLYKQDDEGNLVEVENEEEATIVKTDYLKEIEIGKFDRETMNQPLYEDVKIEFIVDENELDESRMIENIVKTDNTDDDSDSDNNTGIEKLYVKYFDLEMHKYIDNVVVKSGKAVIKRELGKDNKELLKIDVEKTKIKETVISVTYGLQVKNVGQIPGYATRIIDERPNGFKLVDNKGWTEKGNKIVTTQLQDKLLQPGESTTILVTMEYKVDENEIGEKLNIAEIYTYKNDYNAKDITPDNKDQEPLLISIRTGEGIAWAGLICGAALMIVGIVIAVVKYRKGEL